jgi:1-acyl-sn-glycerol-3-phosphate acyltransferase
VTSSDPLKPQVYKDPRPAEHFTKFHERVRRGKPNWMYEVVRCFVTPILVFGYRVRSIDSDNVPPIGATIIAPNHFSNLDHFFVGVGTRRRVQFMAKSQLFKIPIELVYSHGGVFPVRRGQRDEETFVSAHAIMARGDAIVMYPEGGRSRTGELQTAKPGIGRLALETGVPVVPTAVVGTAGVRHWRRLRFPSVTVQYAEPIQFERVESPTREQAQAAADQIFERTRALYDSLEAAGRSRAVKAARAARRAARRAAASSAEAAGRRPVAP